MAKSNFIVRGGADFSAIKNEIDKAQKYFKGFQSGLSGGFKTLGKLTGVAIGAKALVDFGKKATGIASDLIEVQNVVDTTFGHMSKEVNEFAQNSIKDFGLSELSAKQYTSTMGAMLKSSGITGEAVKDMSIEMTKLTADVASFYNLDGDEAFQKIRAGISGQTEPLKQLGINMNVANMQAYALSQGIKKKWQHMSQAEQTMLRYNYLLSVTGDAQGDFAKESGTMSNQLKILKEQWQEFMSLIGKALIEVLLPIVKFLNNTLELLIKITKKIGEIYAMVTGKEVAIETNSNISDTALDAADGENKLANGIDKAAKAAKKALAPFDELNILQSNLNDGNGSGLGTLNTGGLNTMMSTKKVDDGLKINIDDEEPKKFFIWFTDKWNGLKQMLSIPVMVPAPMFAGIPNPIYEPNWGLTPPLVPAPVFNPIKNPVYKPNWGLDTPKVKAPYFPPILSPVYQPEWNLEPPTVPALDYSLLEKSMGEIGKSVERHLGKIQEGYKVHEKELGKITNSTSQTVNKETQTGLDTKTKSISTAIFGDEKNFNTHKENVGKIATATGGVLAKGFAEGLNTKSKNTITASTADEKNLNTHGANVGIISSAMASTLVLNTNKGYESSYLNTTNFANASIEAMNQMGNGMAKSSASGAEAINTNYANSFSSVFENFRNTMSAIGEKVSGWFSANKKIITTTAIVGAGAIAAGGLALAFPGAIPYVAGALGGLSSIPALAKGGITNGPTLAMIGDNPGGKEVVSPLDGLLDMIKDATSESSGDINLNLVVQLGEDTITDKMISNINRKNRISGQTVIKV